MDARRFPNTWHPLSIIKQTTKTAGPEEWAYLDDEMGHINILCDDLQPRNGVAVSDVLPHSSRYSYYSASVMFGAMIPNRGKTGPTSYSFWWGTFNLD